MGQVIIRNLPESLIDQLKLKAEINGHSLEQHLREILSREVRLTPKEKLALIDSAQAMQKKPLLTDSTDIIRKYRDSR